LAASHRGSSLSIAMGGDESEPGSRRQSRESRRSLEGIRRSVDGARKMLGKQEHSSEDGIKPPLLEERLVPVDMPVPRTFYLLISPLLPPVSMFATMFFKHGRSASDNLTPSQGTRQSTSSADKKLTSHATLAIYGDSDFFTSQRKLRKWAEYLSRDPGSRFRFREIVGAGHFWHEDGAEAQLRSIIGDWVQDI